MTSGHQPRVLRREDYLTSAAEFIRLAQELLEDHTSYHEIRDDNGQQYSARKVDMCTRLAEVNIAMAAELRAETQMAMGRWRP